MESIYLLQVALAVLVMSLVAQSLSRLFKMPVLIFLLAEGIIAGPEVLGLLDPSLLGEGLAAIVSLCVAVIVFDGGLHIDLKSIRSIQQGVLSLITVGVIITFIFATLFTHYIVGLSLEISAVFGALVTATGPTVITPVVRQVRVNHRVSKTLELEGVLNDAVCVILAALVFEVIISQLSGFEAVSFIVYRTMIGLTMGIASGLLLTRFLSSSVLSEQVVRFVTFTSVIATFVIAESLGAESGILAVALFGIIVGSSNVRYKAALKEFKSDLVLMMLSLIFILLAAMLKFEDIFRIGFAGIIVVLLLVFFVRPLSVFVSTARTNFRTKEKLFISFVGPRGVVPASIATYFAIKMNSLNIEGGQELVGLVFLTVIITVLMTGSLSKYVAKFLGVIPMEILVVGGGEVGRILAERFEKRGENVVVVESSEEHCQRLMKSGIRVVHGDAEDVNVLKKAGIENAKYVVASTNQDNTNLLVCQIAKTKFGFKEDQIVARVNNMENLHAFWDLEIRAMSPAMSTALFLDNMVGRPHMFSMCEVGEGGDILEVKVTNPKVAGKSIKELSLPEDSLLLMVRRGDQSFIANGNLVLEFDDVVTVIGEGDAAKIVADLLGR
ncbi:cation:proton antiporter [Methanococcoides burtonii]|uniref:Sodium/hydrogen antiporter n=1 Tax=Methanococcoides burtonii (strain DSM 6242 / NBRC 107633 / OCM 468 / ACE-M) TaxID=259564 RepID=Q12W95_METBU|nr:cation:proton antiporter [Methanococcoides burtonii]ABE52281.1 sodium/hydrogen antiporter [Methanococcoides burtonii DSM 6242]